MIIKNSYNYGIIVGGIVDGIVNYSNNGEFIVNNNYSLDSACSTISGQTITSEELENLASTLGLDVWTSDVKENNSWLYNNGYPILKWYLIDND